MSAIAKGKQQLNVQCIEHTPYYLTGLSPAHFSDLSRNSCIYGIVS